MPIVKRYERGVPFRKADVPSSDIRMNEDAFGAATARGMEHFGEELESVGTLLARNEKVIEERNDKSAAKDAFVNFGDQLRTKDTELRKRQKGDTKGITSEAYKYVDETLHKIESGLGNERQKELFRSLAQERRSTFIDGISGYEASEYKKWSAESSSAMVQEAIQSATENYTNPNAIKDVKNKIDIAVTSGMPGSSAEAIKFEKERQISILHTEVINRMAVDDAFAAKKYYEDHKDEIDGPIRTQIENNLKALGVKQRSQIEADKISASGLDYESQLESARKIKDPDVRDATLQRIKLRHEEQKKIEIESRQKVIDDTVNKIINAGSFEIAMDIADTVENGTDRNSLRNLARSEYEARKRKTSDYSKYVEAKNRVDNGDIGSAQQLLVEYKPYLTDSDWKDVESYYRNGGATGGLSDSTVRSIFKSLTGSNADDEPELYHQIWTFVERNLSEGKKPTDAELRKLVSQGLMEGENVDKKGWFDENMSYIEAVEKGVTDTWLPNVTKEEKRRISNILKSLGKKVTSESIRLYKKHVIMGLPLPAPKTSGNRVRLPIPPRPPK